jgi:hypothetical protein
VDFDLKYTPASQTSSLANISRWVEMLIDQPTTSVISQQPSRMPFQAPRNASH